MLAERRTKSQEFFASSAGQWDRLRDELFGDRFHLAALAALADATWTVGDLGCGTGQVSAALAPFVARVIAVDASAAMLQAARKRLQRVRQRRAPPRRARGAADRRWPARRGDADAGAASRAGAGARAAPKSRASSSRAAALIVVDMLPHDRESYRQQMGHVWLGFGDDHVRRLLSDAGFDDVRIVPLPPDAKAKGPGLFVATARRSVGRVCQTRRRSAGPRDRRRGESMATVTEKMHPFDAAQGGGPRAVQGRRTWRWPNSAARKSGSPSRRCPA